MAPATISLPAPLSPVIKTGASPLDALPTILKTLCMAEDLPIIVSSGPSAFLDSVALAEVDLISSPALSASSTTGLRS